MTSMGFCFAVSVFRLWPEHYGSCSAGERLSCQPCEGQSVHPHRNPNAATKEEPLGLCPLLLLVAREVVQIRPSSPFSGLGKDAPAISSRCQVCQQGRCGHWVVNSHRGNTFIQILETVLFQRHFVGMQICLSRFRMKGRNRSK